MDFVMVYKDTSYDLHKVLFFDISHDPVRYRQRQSGIYQSQYAKV